METKLSLLGLALLAISGNVTAETFQPPTTQNHNGNECVGYYAPDITKFDHDVWGIRNISSKARFVSCPIVETEPFFNGVTGGTFGGIRVFWVGQGTITCTVASHGEQGGFYQTQTASKTGSGWFTVPEVRHDSSTVYGKYSMHCLLPPSGYLATYQARLRVNF
jgi:hypothetical protein